MFDNCWFENTELELFMHTDASGEIGVGAYFQGHWVSEAWPAWVKQLQLDIQFKELVAIALALYLWADSLSNKKRLLFCDNEGAVQVINKMSSRFKPSMHIVRFIVSVALKHNLLLKAKHLPEKVDCIADALSRLWLSTFHKLAPQADKAATPVPTHLWQQLMPK